MQVYFFSPSWISFRFNKQTKAKLNTCMSKKAHTISILNLIKKGVKKQLPKFEMIRYYYTIFKSSADLTVFCISMVIVIGPTPPGTGVI